jgi:hypothetical protein
MKTSHLSSWKSLLVTMREALLLGVAEVEEAFVSALIARSRTRTEGQTARSVGCLLRVETYSPPCAYHHHPSTVYIAGINIDKNQG